MNSTTKQRFTGRFAEWEPLGEGGEGKLYRVRDRWTGRMAALKVADEAVARDALIHEFRLLSFLRHPCLIESSDLVREDEALAHLLEYVPAVDPRSLWDEGGEEAVWAALTQALRGLTYLHRRGYVHGDVAPGNILIWRDGDRWRAKVADLGLTLKVEAALESGVRGTPGFMAPETARGEGLVPGSDLYALAATAVCWIDGRGPWEGASAAEQLKRVAAGDDVPRPKRRISPELESLLMSLGRAAPDDRSPGEWSELREVESRWGPPTLRATVVGLDETMAEWREWFAEVPPGQVASILVSGRVGTGKKTLCRSFARSLVSEGWTALWDLPLDSMRDWLEAVEGDPDPVQLARALAERFADKDVVLLWPERVGEVESRLLQAFVTGREGEEGGVRTLVVHAGGFENQAEIAWLNRSTRTKSTDWTGPSQNDLVFVRDDLFDVGDVDFNGVTTPSAAEVLKLATLEGRDISLLEGREATVEEVKRAWEIVSHTTREALGLLSLSCLPWSLEDLGEALGLSDDQRKQVASELAKTRLTARTFQQDHELEHVSDWITGDVLRANYVEQVLESRISSLSETLENTSIHPFDLGLVQFLTDRHQIAPRYTLIALDRALGVGNYGQVLGLISSFKKELETTDKEIWDRLLRAAHQLGKYAEQVEILEVILEKVSDAEARSRVRKSLAVALANQGDWRRAVEQCDLVEAEAAESLNDRIWARLQAAETLWQAGLFAQADEVYGRVKDEIQEGHDWLRFAVGRARESGQQGDMKGVARYLETAREKAGKKRCEEDVSYLNTLAGLELEMGNGELARAILESALDMALAKGDWNSYMMVLARSSALASGLGEVKKSRRLDRDGLTTALALGSERIAGRLHGYLAFSQTLTGEFGSSLRNLDQYLRIAEALDDKNMQIQAHQFTCSIASHAGWRKILGDSMDRLNSIADDMNRPEIIIEAKRFLGIIELGARNWSSAIQHFQDDLRAMRKHGRIDSELETRFLLAVTKYRQDGGDRPQDELKRIQGSSVYLSVRKLHAPFDLVWFEVFGGREAETRALAATTDLWNEGRFLDLYEWLPYMLPRASNDVRVDIKKKLLSAIERILGSIDDASLRKQFLSFPRTQDALRAIRG